ncbi:hypothetical protein [Methylibium petroleiphilum]|uniref:hypothetical protein n=1 Tax=Methylibium petroleiphilum TaxID=105560 RepID=UPI001ACD719C|nr:hypothetical protein [Methylibium petroleiphilum]MBN9205687.1 hypothetical protein [Methylibium petroleiphilum]
MADRYTKTETGRAEIRARVHALTRTARNLLLIIDPSRDGANWVSMVQGASAADLQTLVDAGLVAQLGGPSVVPSVPPSEPSTAPAPATAPGALEASSLSYSDLYDLLPSLAKQHLGLMKGYRFVLAIEKADGLVGLQSVARDLLTEIERAKGAAVARSARRALLLP